MRIWGWQPTAGGVAGKQGSILIPTTLSFLYVSSGVSKTRVGILL